MPSSSHSDDNSQLKNHREIRMLMLVDPADVVPVSKEIDQDITEPTITPAAQPASDVSSKAPFVSKRIQGKQLPLQFTKSNELTSTSLSNPKPAKNPSKNDCTFEDEDEDIHETVSSDPNYYEQHSYNLRWNVCNHAPFQTCQ